MAIKKMDKITEEASKANLRSRQCAECPLNTRPKSRCTEEIWQICHDSFIDGFKKGAEYNKKLGL